MKKAVLKQVSLSLADLELGMYTKLALNSERSACVCKSHHGRSSALKTATFKLSILSLQISAHSILSV